VQVLVGHAVALNIAYPEIDQPVVGQFTVLEQFGAYTNRPAAALERYGAFGIDGGGLGVTESCRKMIGVRATGA
jgi:hypothetical protein